MDLDLESLPPELLQMLMGLGTADERSKLVEQQLASAAALRSGANTHTTPLGAGVGGAASVLNNIAASIQEDRLAQKQDEQLAAKERARMEFIKALSAKPPAPQATSGMAAPSVIAALKRGGR